MNARVEQLFHELSDLSREARANYFARNPVDDETRREVEALLAYDQNGGTHLQHDVAAVAASALPHFESAGLRCGPYCLLSVIGRGGMGTVYLAERADGEVSQRVAVKLLPFGAGDPQRQRFLQERQIFAGLAHPNIARMLDAGHAENGQPFLAMEFVDGKPIDAFTAGLGPRERAALFVKVCRAVAYLHRNLVVHRDLKPGNILVTPEGEPKLLDFGISKILDVAPDSTVTSIRMLTPDYASPEQVTGGRITTASDIYSLGAVLHQLLTGRPPHQFQERSPDAISQVLAGGEVARPSRLAPELKGDLDSILLKALRKDPQDRYRTAEDFAADLEAFLNSRPVKARSANTVYLTRKWLRRHWVTATLSALAFVAVAGGAVATYWEARTALRERDFAYRQLSRSEALNELHGFFMEQMPINLASRKALDDAEQMVRRGYGNDLAIRAELLRAVAESTPLEDGRDGIVKRFEEAYRVARAVRDPSIRAKTACSLALTVSARGDWNRGEALLREGLAELPSAPEYMFDRAMCLDDGGQIARYRGDNHESIARTEAAVQALRQSPFPSDLQAGLMMLDLGAAYHVAGRNRDACATLRSAVEKFAAIGRDDTASAGTAYYHWSRAEASLGHPIEAEKLSSKSMSLFDGAESEDLPPFFVANHAGILRDLGRLDDAAKWADRAYNKAKKMDDESTVRQALLLRSSISRLRGDIPKAVGAAAEAEAMLARKLPPGDIQFASLRSEQSLLAQMRGDHTAAMDLANQALTIAEASVKQGRPGADLIPTFLMRRSTLERELNRLQESESDALKALALAQDAAVPGKPSALLGDAWLTLGRARQSQGKPGEASAAFHSAAEQLSNSLGADNAQALAARQLAEADSRR